MQDLSFDELDIAIVDAVRSAPRASWRDLAPVLGVDPATVSRRWSRMQSAGVAWVTAHQSGSTTPSGALVEINCTPGRAGEVAGVLADDVEAATIKLTAGARDVLVLAQAPDLDALSAYLLDRVEHVPGLTSVRSHIVTRSAIQGSRWREGALDLEQRRRLHAHARTRPERGGVLETPDHVGSLISRLDKLGAFDQAESQSVASDGATTKINLAEGWIAQIARLDAADRPITVASACAWQIKTNLSVTYDRASQALDRVVGRPDAALSCGGNFGLPVRQEGTLSHRLNGTTDMTIGTQRCNDPAEGCPNTNVVGTYRCDGAACAGTHQLVLEHTWTLPGQYVWQDAPEQCDVSDRGRTLTCTTETKTVRLPATRGGISVSDADATA